MYFTIVWLTHFFSEIGKFFGEGKSFWEEEKFDIHQILCYNIFRKKGNGGKNSPMRKFLASWLLGGDVVSWKRMFNIAVDCNDECKKMLKRMEQLFELYRETSEKQIATLNAIDELGNTELKNKIMEIYNEE